MSEVPPLRVQATKPTQLPDSIELSYGKDTEKSLTDSDYGYYVPYKESSEDYAFVFNESIKNYKKKHQDARRYHGPISLIRKLYTFKEGAEDAKGPFLNFVFTTRVPEEAAELQIRFYFRQEGQDFNGRPKDYDDFGVDRSPMHNMVYPKRIYYIHFPTLATPLDFDDDGFYEKQTLPATKIPVLTNGLKWYALQGYGDPDSKITGDNVAQDDKTNIAVDVWGNTIEPVAGPDDQFIYLPSIDVSFKYYFNKDKISVKISNMEFRVSGTNIITISKENPNCASLGFMGRYDDKFNGHRTWPVFWVRVDKAYADAHPKEVRKRGYFYYRKEDIGDWFNWDDNHILQQISCDDDLEYSISINDLQPFKDRINQFVHDNYGGFDVPLSMPTLLKFSRYEHAGNSIALNIFVHPKGVL